MTYDTNAGTFRCDYCAQPLRPDALGVAKRQTCWTENRKGGGAHGIKFPEAPIGYAHTACLNAAKHPSARTQQLF